MTTALNALYQNQPLHVVSSFCTCASRHCCSLDSQTDPNKVANAETSQIFTVRGHILECYVDISNLWLSVTVWVVFKTEFYRRSYNPQPNINIARSQITLPSVVGHFAHVTCRRTSAWARHNLVRTYRRYSVPRRTQLSFNFSAQFPVTLWTQLGGLKMARQSTWVIGADARLASQLH